MKNLNIFLGIFSALAISRFIPHPPNFTIAIALSFYVPYIFGQNKLFYVLISFIITDFIIGYHLLTHWTWGSILAISLISNFFLKNIQFRYLGLCLSTLIFFIITNFGVWTLGNYGYTVGGLIECFILAIPFYGNTLISSLFFATCIELLLFIIFKYKKKTKSIMKR